MVWKWPGQDPNSDQPNLKSKLPFATLTLCLISLDLSCPPCNMQLSRGPNGGRGLLELRDHHCPPCTALLRKHRLRLHVSGDEISTPVAFDSKCLGLFFRNPLALMKRSFKFPVEENSLLTAFPSPVNPPLRIRDFFNQLGEAKDMSFQGITTPTPLPWLPHCPQDKI